VRGKKERQRITGGFPLPLPLPPFLPNTPSLVQGFTPLGSRELKKLFLGTDALDGEYLYTQTKR